MKFGVGLQYDGVYMFDLWRRVIGLMNKYDFNSIWMGDHRLQKAWPRLDVSATMPALAILTDKMTIGTNILLAPFYHPLFLAEYWASLDVITKGRIILGLGAGYVDYEFESYEVPRKERFSRLEETVEIIKKLWTEPPVTFNGRHYHFKEVSLPLKPLQKPRPPIWVGATSPSGIRRAARIGDACCLGGSLPRLKDYYQVYKKNLKEVGKDFDEIEKPYNAFTCVARTYETSRRAVETLLLEDYREHRRRPGRPRDFEEREQTFEDLERRYIIGTPDEAIDKIEKLKKYGVNHVIFRLSCKGMIEQPVLNSVKLIGEKVIPYFTEDPV